MGCEGVCGFHSVSSNGGGRFILFIKCNTCVYNLGTAVIAVIILRKVRGLGGGYK
jgi:hypothetical protein